MLEMFPTKSIMEYLAEMNRLFSNARENDIPDHPYSQYYPSPIHHQSPNINHSSSSADSISPESYPNSSFSDTPCNRRLRPIVGRRIFEPSQIAETLEKEFEQQRYHKQYVQKPEVTGFTQNYDFVGQNYELLAERDGFRTPIKTSAPFNVSPSSSGYSPTANSFGTSPQPMHMSPNIRKSFSRNQTPVPQDFGQAQKMCTFCRKNGEASVVYMTHTVRTRVGNRSIVSCPILRSHVCEACGAYGDDAHTITYCPVLRSTNNGVPFPSTTITLKNTRVKSNGTRRY